MTRLLVLCSLALLWPASVLGEPNSDVIHSIVLSELSAMRFPPKSPFCLALLPAANHSPQAADPSPELLSFLARKGMRPQKASICYKAPKGNVISIEIVPGIEGRLSAKVAFGNVSIPPGEDLGVLWHRGVYEFTRTPTGKWVIKSYASEINEPPRTRPTGI